MRLPAILASAIAFLTVTVALQSRTNSTVGVIESGDLDRDGLSDDFEQSLLVRFAPKFWISSDECDVLPAEFQRQSRKPRLVSRNGTIYGQIFKSSLPGRSGTFLEIHYYHLWNRDCGRRGHDLDVEHVSVLLEAASSQQPPMNWKAIYWYAAAHEDTVCAFNHGVKASTVNAVDHGADVWISSGKHGSFLERSLLGRGCGADHSYSPTPLEPHALINIGELNSPMNGAFWIHSDAWLFSAKMKSDFTADRVASLDSEALQSYASPRSTQAVISFGNSTLDAVANSDRSSEAALRNAKRSTDQALSLSFANASAAIHLSRRAVARKLGVLTK